MGLCQGKVYYEPPTKAEIQRNKEINELIKKERQQIKKELSITNKILLLGIIHIYIYNIYYYYYIYMLMTYNNNKMYIYIYIYILN